MTKPLEAVQLILCIPLLAFSISACANSYRGAAIEGRVVDAETKQPVKDVVVVIEWQLYGRPMHPDIIGRLLLQETVTDAAGRYRFPAWGPLKPKEGVMDRNSPALNFYKRGYKFITRRNYSYEPPYIELPDPLISEWDGKTIELWPYRDKLDQKSELHELGECCYLYSLDEEKCAWQQMPRLTAELMKRAREYRKQGLITRPPSRGRLMYGGKCPDPDQVLKDYFDE